MALEAGEYLKATDGTHAATDGVSLSITIPILLSSTQVDLNEGTGVDQLLYLVPTGCHLILTKIVLHHLSGDSENATISIFGIGPGDPINGFDAFLLADSVVTPASSYQTTAVADGQMFPRGTAGQELSARNAIAEGVALTARVDVFGYLTDEDGVPIANVVGTAP